MKVYIPSEYGKLPKWQIRLAVLHAQGYVEDVMGLSDSDDKYAKEVEKETIKFLKEGIEESLTPHMPNPRNPTSPKVTDAFLEQPFFSIDGTFFTEYMDDKDEREKYFRLLRSSVNTLALIYLAAARNIKSKDYQFERGDGKIELAQKNVNRFNRLFVVTSIMSMLEPLFRTNPKALEKFLDDGLKPQAGQLDKPEFRSGFISRLRNQITKEGFNAASLKKIF